jgi:hypothetical protein
MAIAGKVTVTIGVTTGCLALSPVPRRGTKLPKGEPTAARLTGPPRGPRCQPRNSVLGRRIAPPSPNIVPLTVCTISHHP